ncbi:hypothetical protein [Robiginitalea myxolifaciens]|nr:hypothetical protein [Robiginitalea myxolifaciens]
MERKSERLRRVRLLALWTFVWTISTALVVFGSEFIWNGTKGLTVFALGINILLGIGMILAHRNFLEILDELERKIQLESMAITLGLTLVIGLAYSMLDVTDVIPWDAEISFLVMFMGICYMLAIFMNTRRYR